MAEFFAYRIINGYTTFAKVPTSLQAAVETLLKNAGHENLITEGNE